MVDLVYAFFLKDIKIEVLAETPLRRELSTGKLLVPIFLKSRRYGKVHPCHTTRF